MMSNRLKKTILLFFLICISFISSAQNKSLEYYKQGNLYVKSKQYDKALEQYDFSIAEDVSFYKAYRNKGFILSKLGNYQEAVQTYNKAISLDNTDYRLFYDKGKNLFNMRQYQEALSSFNQSINLNPNYCKAYNNKGVVLLKINQPQEAINNFNKAIELNPKFYEAYFNKITPLFKLGLYQEFIENGDKNIALDFYYKTIEVCDKAISLKTNRNDLYIVYANKGLALNKLGRYKEAIETAEIALKLNPDYELASFVKKHALSSLNDPPPKD